MNMIQIGIIGVAGTLLAVQFKSGKSEYGIYISVALSLVIFFAIIGRLEVIIDALRTIANYINMDTAYIGTLIKDAGDYLCGRILRGHLQGCGLSDDRAADRDIRQAGGSGIKHAGSDGAFKYHKGISVMRRRKIVQAAILWVILLLNIFPAAGTGPRGEAVGN